MKHRLGSGTDNMESTSNEETVANTKTRRVLPATLSRVMDSTCIFCGKSKYIKKSNTREPLLQCRELRADVKIREYAKRTMNTRLFGLVECRELVAAEAKYHASCYRLCIGSLSKSSSTETVAEDNSVKTAYTFIVDFIENTVFVSKECIPLADMSTMYMQKLIEFDSCAVTDSTNRNLRSKLERTFGTRLRFCQGEFIVFRDFMRCLSVKYVNTYCMISYLLLSF